MDKTSIIAELITQYNNTLNILIIGREFQKHDFFFNPVLSEERVKELENDLNYYHELICLAS